MLHCENCGRPIERPDRAYFLMEVPRQTLAEVHHFLSVNAVAYCPDCIQVLRVKSKLTK
ncbi:hypothetical protein [Lactiplantibacillus modestisalitolerans]|uniref:Uncharacterized protein n=1 Tax=Lactiplantibacillus modestisalitolerans TaxID=1457219 RepID=A0ABV5WWJ0_9LACO|nr:hypothetical protein [Lactiplantibacillus modestisalitolerans]